MIFFHIVTLFPEFFDSPLSTGLMQRAKASGLVDFSFHNPRNFSSNKYGHVDDTPYGGGPGMVIRAQPVAQAIRSIADAGRIVLMSPSGMPFNQPIAHELSREKHITIVCGRYEGIDARLGEFFDIEPLCLTDAVLNGGECAALSVMEAVARLIPGFMGKPESGYDESFSAGLLEYPQYTHPAEIEGHKVPALLTSGNHSAIAAFRRKGSIETTFRYRPEMLDSAKIDIKDADLLKTIPRERLGRQLCFCLLHSPVMLDSRKTGTSSLTNLDIHDISRVSCSYGLGPFVVVTPLEDQRLLLEGLLHYWQDGPGGRANPDRKRALVSVKPASTLEEAVMLLEEYYGKRPMVVASSATWPDHKHSSRLVTTTETRNRLNAGPVMILLGTGHGLPEGILAKCDGQLRPLRFMGYNHLSVRSAAAILADRILGDYF